MAAKTIEETLLGRGFEEVDGVPFLQMENPVEAKFLPLIIERITDSIARGKIKRFAMIPYKDALEMENVIGKYYNIYVMVK
jgi:hypothetical protein